MRPFQLKTSRYLTDAPGRAESGPMRSALTGLSEWATRMAYNKNASPAAQAKRTLHGLMECDPLVPGWNMDMRPRVAVFTVMISAV